MAPLFAPLTRYITQTQEAAKRAVIFEENAKYVSEYNKQTTSHKACRILPP
jgi:hypothetical protein